RHPIVLNHKNLVTHPNRLLVLRLLSIALVQLFANTVTYEETNDLTNAQFPMLNSHPMRIGN
ncbi:MAG: hypothetical protein DMG12_10230, partial [Acidobacteria bacterium]